jgi:hypothetical protein
MLLLFGFGCADAPVIEDSSPVEPPVEDCDSFEDEDGDGLAGCEDPDCVDACFEDCGNGLDDDLDGDVDCVDDECLGQPECPQQTWRVEVTVVLDEVRLATGPATRASYGDIAALWAEGAIYLQGEPIEDGQPFTCSGVLSAAPGAGSSASEGDCDGCQVRVAFEPSTFWVGLCPVEALPLGYLGWDVGADRITRDLPEGWSDQYLAGEADWTRSGEDDHGLLLDLEQQLVWDFTAEAAAAR